jgi:hypothetical protein
MSNRFPIFPTVRTTPRGVSRPKLETGAKTGFKTATGVAR